MNKKVILNTIKIKDIQVVQNDLDDVEDVIVNLTVI